MSSSSPTPASRSPASTTSPTDVRVVTGQAADSVITASGEQIGIGDTIATRQNDAEVGVANREMWTVIDSSAAGLHVKGENGQRVLPPAYVHEHVELAYATTAYGAQGSTVTTSHVLIGEHTGAASAYVGMTRGRERNVAHLVAESIEDARTQWIEVFGRDRADLGPSHAAGWLPKPSTATARCRPATPAAHRRQAVRRPEHDLTYRPPAPSSRLRASGSDVAAAAAAGRSASAAAAVAAGAAVGNGS